MERWWPRSEIPGPEYQLLFFPALSQLLNTYCQSYLTVVDVDLAVAAREAGHTVALVVVLLVDAGGSVLTGRTEQNN